MKCIVFYLNYWVEGKFQRYQSEFGGKPFKTFRALIITTSQARLQHMREAVTRLPFPKTHVKRFLWGTTEAQATIHSLFEPIWCSMDTSDHSYYKIG